jgi:lipopolysaccharide transport system permease protein
MAEKPTLQSFIRLQPQKRWHWQQWRTLWQYRDLLLVMVQRDVSVQYKQTVLGFGWAVFQPVVSMVVFTIVFGKLAGMPSEGLPYAIFAYTALIPWTYFSNTLVTASNSLVQHAALLTKVYFPRLIIPLTPVFAKLLDLVLSFSVLLLLLAYYKMMPGWNLVYLPVILLLMMVTVTGLALLFATLALQFRDVKFVLTFLTPMLLYAAPVVFPAGLIEEKFGNLAYRLYGLYPMAGVIEGFRAALLPNREMPWELLGMGALSAITLLAVGLWHFNNMEQYFSDIA